MIYRPSYVDKIMAYVDTPFVKNTDGCASLRQIDNPEDDHVQTSGSAASLNPESSAIASIPRNFGRYDRKAVVQELKSRVSPEGKTCFFLDEMQEIRAGRRSSTSLSSDYDVDLYITGSNSRMMSSEISTYLTGRYVSFRIFTPSLCRISYFQRAVRRCW